MWRLFVALALPPRIREALSRRAGELMTGARGWRLVPQENLHLTLRFLGDTDPATAERLCRQLGETVRPVRVLRLRLDDWGTFPERRRPRVTWCALAGEVDALRELAERVEKWAREAGYPGETRPFRPHVTVARARSPRAAMEMPDLASEAGSRPEFECGEVVLFRSHLGQGPPRYEALAVHELAGGKASE
jgi:2'-5' RNA ligase